MFCLASHVKQHERSPSIRQFYCRFCSRHSFYRSRWWHQLETASSLRCKLHAHGPTYTPNTHSCTRGLVAFPKRHLVGFQFGFYKKKKRISFHKGRKTCNSSERSFEKSHFWGRDHVLLQKQEGLGVPSMLPLWSKFPFYKTEHRRKVSFNIPPQPRTDLLSPSHISAVSISSWCTRVSLCTMQCCDYGDTSSMVPCRALPPTCAHSYSSTAATTAWYRTVVVVMRN